MTRISLLPDLPRLLTDQELRSIVGTTHPYCLQCGGNLFSISLRGEWICWECDSTRAHAAYGIALQVVLLSPTAEGLAAAVHTGRPVLDSGPDWCGRLAMGIAADYDAEHLKREQGRAMAAAGVELLNLEGKPWAAWDCEDGELAFASLVQYTPEEVIKAGLARWPMAACEW